MKATKKEIKIQQQLMYEVLTDKTLIERIAKSQKK